jgi:hypothetical protein
VPPCICQTCGFIFKGLSQPGMNQIEFQVEIAEADAPEAIKSVDDLSFGPCPRCRHGRGRVPQGMWKEVVATAKRLRVVPSATLEQIRAVVEEVQAEKSASVEETAAKLEAADPALAELAALVRSQSNRMEVWTILSIIVPVLIWLASRGSAPAPAPVVTEKIVVEVVTQAPQTDWSQPGRNAQCPCGSGAKFKRCHGAGPSARPTAAGGPTSSP